MGRAYNVIDADGHILEPLDLWDKSWKGIHPFATGDRGFESISLQRRVACEP